MADQNVPLDHDIPLEVHNIPIKGPNTPLEDDNALHARYGKDFRIIKAMSTRANGGRVCRVPPIAPLFAGYRKNINPLRPQVYHTQNAVLGRQLVPGFCQVSYEVFDVPLVKVMCAEAKIIAWLTNDLMDFNRLNHSNYNASIVTNSITALFKQSNCISLQGAVNRVYRRLHEGIDSFESRAKSLVGHKYHRPNGRQGVVTEGDATRMRDILRNVFVGNFIWMSSRHQKR